MGILGRDLGRGACRSSKDVEMGILSKLGLLILPRQREDLDGLASDVLRGILKSIQW
jgi:hypothetical protein